jgi:hypothetical protein
MNTSTSLTALAALAVGSALLASATPADAARGGFRPAPARSAPVRAPVSLNRAPAPTSVPRSNARSLIGDLGKIGSAAVNEVKTVGGDIVAGKVQNIPGDVLKTGSKVAGAVVKTGVNIFTLPPPKLPSAPPAPAQKPIKHTGTPVPTTATTSTASTTASTVLPGTTGGGANGATIKLTPTPAPTGTASSPTTSSPTTSSTTASTGSTMTGHPSGMRPSNYPMRPQYAGRPGYGTYAPTMSQGPAYAAPAYVAPAYVAPAPAQTYAPAQTSCLRQAMTPDGQVVTFDICTNKAVVGPQAQVQTQPQTQTQ